MFGFEPGADGSGSKYANHCAMLLPLPPSIEESFDSVLAHNFLSPSEGSIKTNKIVGNEMKLQITIFFHTNFGGGWKRRRHNNLLPVAKNLSRDGKMKKIAKNKKEENNFEIQIVKRSSVLFLRFLGIKYHNAAQCVCFMTKTFINDSFSIN